MIRHSQICYPSRHLEYLPIRHSIGLFVDTATRMFGRASPHNNLPNLFDPHKISFPKQIWIHEKDAALPANDRYFATAPWSDAKILGPPKQWGGDIPDGKIVLPTQGFGKEGKPTQWPLPLTKAHWAVLHPGLNPGQYTIRCRTIDKNGNAQPMPRPFRKSGHAAIQSVNIVVS